GLYPRMCSVNTRMSTLCKVESWAQDISLHLSIFWIIGRPGTGKSTILRTLCKLLADSYFCSIHMGSNNSAHILQSIASRLASHFPLFRTQIVRQLQNHPEFPYLPLQEQFQVLLCTPWSEAGAENPTNSRYVVVIDALDECEEGYEVLELIMDAVEKSQLQGLKFLVLSQPIP
ncbi:hypothetical protein DL96DRAFT_1454076, partial [Flagelloscypha sp. PMI_526]